MTQNTSEYSHRKKRLRRYHNKGRSGTHEVPKKLPLIFFCADPHGEFAHINEAVTRLHPDAVVLLGDLQPKDSIDVILGPTMAVCPVWWIPGNHDTDTDEFYDRLWHGSLAQHNLHGKVADIAGVRIGGLGGVFRGQIWMPEGSPNYRSVQSFLHGSGSFNLWRGGLPRRHRSSIFPTVYESLMRQHADVLITHEAPGCHKKGFAALDRLAKALGAKWHFHGHQHEDRPYGMYKGVQVRGVGYRGIVDLEGNEIVPAQIDPRDLLAMQQAGEEPSPAELDSVAFQPMPEMHMRNRRTIPRGAVRVRPSGAVEFRDSRQGDRRTDRYEKRHNGRSDAGHTPHGSGHGDAGSGTQQ